MDSGADGAGVSSRVHNAQVAVLEVQAKEAGRAAWNSRGVERALRAWEFHFKLGKREFHAGIEGIASGQRALICSPSNPTRSFTTLYYPS